MGNVFNDSAADQVHSILTKLHLPAAGWVLSGSGPLALRGIRPIGSDIDIYARPFDGVPCDMFFAWSTRRHFVDVQGAVATPQYVEGWPCVSLEYIVYLKQLRCYDEKKHEEDLRLIDDHLSMGGV
jgi:hypothetical protein